MIAVAGLARLQAGQHDDLRHPGARPLAAAIRRARPELRARRLAAELSLPHECIRSGDRIFLRGLAIECIIGFIEWERRVTQTVVIDLELPVDCAHAALTDEVQNTLDYKRVAKRIIAFVGESQFKLVETLAQRTAMMMLAEFGVAVGAALGQQAGRDPRLARCRRRDRAHPRRSRGDSRNAAG